MVIKLAFLAHIFKAFPRTKMNQNAIQQLSYRGIVKKKLINLNPYESSGADNLHSKMSIELVGSLLVTLSMLFGKSF